MRNQWMKNWIKAAVVLASMGWQLAFAHGVPCYPTNEKDCVNGMLGIDTSSSLKPKPEVCIVKGNHYYPYTVGSCPTSKKSK